ncbi:MAG: twin transmembrane helix small protein [Halomonas sp.]|nr:twin transmembrane helix small protein [Halomonas sp.]
MLLKSLIIIVFIAMLISLAVGAGYLLRDGSSSKRLLTSLKWRIGFATLLLLLIIYGFWSGQLT